MQPNPMQGVQEWMPLLGLVAAMAAYVGGIRMWFHRLRMDAVDTIVRQGATVHLERRIRRCVWWLRALMIVDVVLLVAAVVLYKRIFHAWMPSQTWLQGKEVDAFTVAIDLGLLAVFGFCVAHVVSGAWAWYHATNGGGRSWARGGFWALLAAAWLGAAFWYG